MKKPPPKKPAKSPKVRDISTARRETKKATSAGVESPANNIPSKLQTTRDAPKKPPKRAAAKNRGPAPRPKKVHRCGDAGGVSRNGKACGIKTSPGDKCPAHRDTAEATRQLQKSRVIEIMGAGKRLIEAAREIGRDPATLYKWRMNDPEFDAEVAALVEENEEARVKAVEETLYDRIMSGEASDTLAIFFLTNRARDRWKNRHSKEVLGADGKPVDQIPVSQLHALAVKVETLNLHLSQGDLAKLLGVKRVEG